MGAKNKAEELGWGVPGRGQGRGGDCASALQSSLPPAASLGPGFPFPDLGTPWCWEKPFGLSFSFSVWYTLPFP